MSALQIPRRPYKSPGKNILTSPPKKGTGYGYPNVTLSKMEPYPPEPYGRSQEAIKKEMRADRAKMKGGAFRLNLHPKEYFDTNPFKPDKSLPAAKTSEAKESSSSVPFKPSSPCKKMGGMKAGTFDTYPSHSADPYRPRKAASVPSGKVFRLCAGPKSMPFKSIVDMNVGRVVNGTNYRTVMV